MGELFVFDIREAVSLGCNLRYQLDDLGLSHPVSYKSVTGGESERLGYTSRQP